MAKPFKIFLGVIGALVLLIVVAAVALPLLFNPNNYRAQLSKAAKENTGRDLSMGNIELHVFPWLRVAISDAKLGNAPGFGDQPFASVHELDVGVHLAPLLFDKKIEVSSVKLDGLQLNIARNAKGVGNWEDLISQNGKPAPKPEEPSSPQSFKLEDIDIGGVDITNASISFRDDQAKTAYRIDPLNLEVGSLRPGHPFDIKLALTTTSDKPKAKVDLGVKSTVSPDDQFNVITLKDATISYKVKADDPAVETDGTLKAQIVADLARQLFTISGLSLDTTASGKDIPGGKQQLKLAGNITLDQKQGTLDVDQARVETSGLVITTSIKGQGLNGDHPQLSGPISIEPFSPRKLLASLGTPMETQDPQALSSLSLKTRYSGSFSSAALDDLVIKLDDTTLQGRVAVNDFATQAIQFALKADRLDADRYMPPKSADKAEQGKAASGDINAIQLPTDALDKLNANGTLDIAALTVNGAKLTDVHLQLGGSGKAPKTQQVTAKLYGGTVNLNNRYDGGGTPVFAFKTSLNALSAAPFLKDFIGKDFVSGLANLDLDLTSRGRTVGDLRKALNGTVAVKVENGAVKGFNLGQILRNGQAMLSGQAAPAATETKETDFTALSASGKITNGILKTNDLTAASPAFRLTGSGEIDLVNETLNYVASPTVVETSQGQGGKGLDQLKGLTIPIKLTGSIYAPKYKLDIASALRDRAKGQLEKKIGEQLGLPKGESTEQQLKEKAAEKLGDFLFGRKKKSDPPADQQQPSQ